MCLLDRRSRGSDSLISGFGFSRYLVHHRFPLTNPTQSTMGMKYLGAKAAAALDKELMSSGAFTIDQLMELAGLSVSQAGALVLVNAMIFQV